MRDPRRLLREVPRTATSAGLISAVLGVAVATALIGWLRGHADIPNLSMLYLLVVLGLASAFGRAPAVLAAGLAFLAFNFFFVEPVHTFHVANPQEVLALGVLLLTAVVTGQLAAALRARAREAEAREHDVATLYELSQLLGREGPLDQRLALADRRLAALLGVAGWEVLLPDGDGRLAVRAAHGAHEQNDVLCLPLLAGERRLGVLRLVGWARQRSEGERELPRLQAAAGLLAQAVERDRLAREATDAEVLRRADQTKSALLSSVSHDLRTPLASIKASATSLLNEEVDWGRAARRELLLAIDEEADRLTRFVSRLLDLSRVEAGAAQPLKEWHAVAEILHGVAERLDSRGARVHLDLPDDLPLASVDYVMVQQIVANLVENALKYSPMEAPVEVRARALDGQLVIDVADRGAGGPPTERERIFEKFYRARERATQAPGTGIGLAVARGLAQAHGGELSYAPRPGGGSVFSVRLPLETGVREHAVP
ncbi:MAG: DUF4118 domain-containing protein [Chloroflexi bacterium]|nr:DUF4118 domain-containing protein [Chloroflexota bacterium]